MLTPIVGPYQDLVPQLQGLLPEITADIAAAVSSQWVTNGSDIHYSTGNVGIGTADPATLLHLYGTANQALGMTIDAKGTGTAQEAYMNLLTKGDGATAIGNVGVKGWSFIARGDAFSAASFLQNDLQLYFFDGLSAVLGMAWDHAGLVGIGTQEPRKTLDILSTTQAQLRLSYADNTVYADLLVDSAGDLTITPTGDQVKFPATVQLQAANYASQTTGWAISGAGAVDVRHLYTDNLQAKSFILDLEQALAGGQIISKSVAEVAIDFTLPAAGGAASLTVNDLPSAPNMAVFESGDMIRLRQFSRASGALTIADAWGVVTSYVDNAAGTQSWTFTRSAGAQAGTATGSINAKTLALDYGTSGNGVYEVNAIDGIYGVNAPYWQINTWATHPQNGQVIRVRGGNLKGITGVTEYGLYAGDGSVTDTNKYLRITNLNFELKNLGLKIYQAADLAISLEPTTPYFALGNPMPTTYLQISTSGVWMGHTGSSVYKLRIGTTNGSGVLTAGMTWDGTLLNVIGSGTFSGTITASAGTIGGFSLGADYIRDAANSFGLASTVTGGDDVRFWAGDTFANRATAPFRLTEAGALVATSANVTGAITATSGAITGTLAMSGASSAIAIGSTPPTSPTAGTGIWLDRSGMYALTSSVQKAVFGPEGFVAYGIGGFQARNPAGTPLNIYTNAASGGRVESLISLVTAGGGVDGRITIRADNQDLTFACFQINNAQAGFGGTDFRFYNDSLNITGLTIGANAAPNAMLDVRGNATITGNLGIGTSGSSVPLHVLTNVNAGSIMQFQNTNTGNAAYAGLKLSTDGGDSYFYRTSAGYGGGLGDSTIFQDAGGGMLLFYVSVEAMRILNNGKIGMGGTPATSAALDIQSTTGALLPPRMTTTQRDALTALDSMVLFNTTTTKLQVRAGGAWVDLH